MANDDLISRSAAIKEVLGMCPEKTAPGSFDEYGVTVLCGVVDVILKQLPAVDAVPVVHARWIEEEGRPRHWHCSSCKAVVGVAGRFGNYCLYCGAKIGGDTDE